MTAEMVRHGMIPAQIQATHPWRHVVTNILGGTKPGVQAELHSLDLHFGDAVLLCSDGLTEMVFEAQITAIPRKENDPQRACKRLVREANERGCTDDITAIVAQFTPSEPS